MTDPVEELTGAEVTLSNEHDEEPIKIKPLRLNRTQKKLNKFERKRARAKQRKEAKKMNKKLENSTHDDENPCPTKILKLNEPKQYTTPYVKKEGFINNRDLRKLKRERLKKVYEDNSKSLKICIDCSFSDLMSTKEMSRLAQQIGRCQASNKSLSSPVHLTLCNLNEDSLFYKELCRMNSGFEEYVIDKTDQSIQTYYEHKHEQIAYLSPDASKSLETIDVNTTYIIGGLVDETVSKKVTIDKCANLKLNSYSLPIEKYMSRQKAADGVNHFKVFNYSKILAINQVFDIMANFFMSNDWPKALACGVPKRKGFCIKNASETEESSDTKEKPVVLD